MNKNVFLYTALAVIVLSVLYLNHLHHRTVVEEPTITIMVADAFSNQIIQENTDSQEIGICSVLENIILVYGGVSEETAEEWAALIKQISDRYQIDPVWITAMIYHESRFDPYAESKCGARGLMQLMPGTAKAMGVENIDSLYSPDINIETGVKYLVYLKDKWDVGLDLATIAYNQGESVFEQGYSIGYLTVVRNYYVEMSQLKNLGGFDYVNL